MVCAAIILGFLLGTLYTHQTTVKAQSELQVYVVKTDALHIEKKGPISVPGSAIVGFSCTPDHFGPSTFCYTAYVK